MKKMCLPHFGGIAHYGAVHIAVAGTTFSFFGLSSSPPPRPNFPSPKLKRMCLPHFGGIAHYGAVHIAVAGTTFSFFGLSSSPPPRPNFPSPKMKRICLPHFGGIAHYGAVHIAVADTFFSFFDLYQLYPNPESQIQNSRLRNPNSKKKTNSKIPNFTFVVTVVRRHAHLSASRVPAPFGRAAALTTVTTIFEIPQPFPTGYSNLQCRKEKYEVNKESSTKMT